MGKASAQKYIAVYHDPQARTSTGSLIKRLKDSFNPLSIEIRLFDTAALHRKDFVRDPNLIALALPGIIGDVCLYPDLIDRQGSDNLLAYTKTGGVLFKICAGGYHGGGRIEYRRESGKLEERKSLLNLFDAVARGPVQDDSAPVAHLSFTDRNGAQGETAAAYYRGPALHLPEKAKRNEITVIARYRDVPDQPIAIASRKVGKGLAIFSGPHIEIAPLDDPEHEQIRNHKSLQDALSLSQALKPHEQSLQALWHRVIHDIVSHNVATGRLPKTALKHLPH